MPSGDGWASGGGTSRRASGQPNRGNVPNVESGNAISGRGTEDEY